MPAKSFDSYHQLLSFSESDLIDLFDEQRRSTGTIGLQFVRDEIAHRRAQQQFEEMRRLTFSMTRLTWFICLLTVVNIALVAYSVL